MDTADQTARARVLKSVCTGKTIAAPLESDQLCSIGADMTSATSLSLSIYNLLLLWYGLISIHPIIVEVVLSVFMRYSCGYPTTFFCIEIVTYILLPTDKKHLYQMVADTIQ